MDYIEKIKAIQNMITDLNTMYLTTEDHKGTLQWKIMQSADSLRSLETYIYNTEIKTSK